MDSGCCRIRKSDMVARPCDPVSVVSDVIIDGSGAPQFSHTTLSVVSVALFTENLTCLVLLFKLFFLRAYLRLPLGQPREAVAPSVVEHVTGTYDQ